MMLAQVSFELPTVDWGGLSPLLIMAGPVVFLTIWSLASAHLPKRTPSIVASLVGVATIVAAAIQWARIDDDTPQGFSTLASSFGIDGFDVADHADRGRRHPGRALRSRLPRTRGHQLG